jgi:ketosteroid isomerase-like protein
MLIGLDAQVLCRSAKTKPSEQLVRRNMYDQPISADVRKLLSRAYAAFNARDIDAVLSMMHPDVEWPNGMEGGYVYGHDGVREYWTHQWGLIDPLVEPQAFSSEPDGRILVEVHQRVLDKDGGTLLDGRVQHIYSIRDGLVRNMEIRDPSEDARFQVT